MVSTCRADLGLVSPLAQRLADSPQICLELISADCDVEYVFPDVNSDECKRVALPLTMQSSNHVAMSLQIGESIIHFAQHFSKKNYDCVVLLGDRFEVFACAVALYSQGISIVHLAGGETTEGALDDKFRHSITLFSAIHLVTKPAYADKVMELGARPDSVFVVGDFAVDNYSKILNQERDHLIAPGLFNIIFTFHPVTTDFEGYGVSELQQLLAALDCFMRQFGDDVRIIVTAPNSDPGGERIDKLLTDWVGKFEDSKVKYVSTLGWKRYLTVVSQSQLMIGNSSSGLTEGAALCTKVFNVGVRQKGRISDGAVLNVEAIKEVINHQLRSWFINYKSEQSKYDTATFSHSPALQSCKAILRFLEAGK